MLNAEDALGLQEDLAILRNNRNRVQSAALMTDEAAHHAAVGDSLRGSTVALRAQQNHLAKLKANLDALMNDRNDIVALSYAFEDVLKILAKELAKAIDVPAEEMLPRVYEAVSRHYDKHVEDAIARGTIVRDQRRDPEVMTHRDWYIEP